MRLRASTYPASCNPRRKAARLTALSSAEIVSATPIRNTWPARCARAASGHDAAAPPSTPRKARRLMRLTPCIVMAEHSTLEDLLGDNRCLAPSSDTDLAKTNVWEDSARPKQGAGSGRFGA